MQWGQIDLLTSQEVTNQRFHSCWLFIFSEILNDFYAALRIGTEIFLQIIREKEGPKHKKKDKKLYQNNDP